MTAWPVATTGSLTLVSAGVTAGKGCVATAGMPLPAVSGATVAASPDASTNGTADWTRSGTINALMTDSSWIRERKAAAEGHLDAKVSAEDDSPSIDMLDPSLVFTKGKRDDNED